MVWVSSRIVARRDWAEGLWSVTLDAVVLPYEPGQFVNLALEIDGARVKRAYSLASPAGSPAELYLVAVPGGTLSPALARRSVGDEVLVDPRAHGFFVSRELPDGRDLWMFATGTGLGPYLAMLRDGRVFERFERVLLVHSARMAAHLGYREELEELERRRAGFRYVPVTTREACRGLLHGRIDARLRSGELEQRAGVTLEPSTTRVMLCGNPSMLEDVGAVLHDRGLKRHRRREPGQLVTESYW